MPPRGKAKTEAAAATVNSRGELSVELDGSKFVLRPDHLAIEAIEEQLRPLKALYLDAKALEMTNREMAVAVAELMRGHARHNPEDERIAVYREAKPERLSELIYEAGGPTVAARLAIIFGCAMTGGYTASGEAKTPAMRKGSTPAGG